LKKHFKKIIILLVLGFFTFSSYSNVISKQLKIQENQNINTNLDSFELEFSFSYPEIVEHYNYSVIKVNETNHNRIKMFDYETNYPVLPVNLSVFEFPFGTIINNVTYENSTQKIIDLKNKIICGKAQFDSINPIKIKKTEIKDLYNNLGEYPENWVEYHTGGGLSYGKRVTFLVLRAYPVRYYPNQHKIGYVSKIKINVSFQEPKENMINEDEKKDLLIISPEKYSKILSPLIDFKNDKGVKTLYFSTEEIYNEDLLPGIDDAEKIKYFIKGAIERWNITHVLLVGGLRGQSKYWDVPVRFSHVIPPDEQEYLEPSFLSDLYFSDVYDSEGRFSSWDSNDDGYFSVWNEEFKEEMDLYPDIYLGRLACRNKFEVRTMVNKIINYESSNVKTKDWFKNILLVGGDSYHNEGGIWPPGEVVVEGEIACDKSMEYFPGYNPLKVYSSNDDINGRTVNEKFNKGASFAYFCGHGSTVSWSTHFPNPINESTNWTGRYHVMDMIPLRNGEKLPITVVGGCHNGEFNISIPEKIKSGLNRGFFKYFFGRFWFDGWNTKCWAWWLTSKINGGAIATIANTGLGTHGDGDQDFNGVVDYIEILDGFLELRFLELYGSEKEDNLGQNHGQAITEYLHKFLGDNAKMDVKMVQQWELFGDPSLKIGGYEK